jgi:hypothetical protein
LAAALVLSIPVAAFAAKTSPEKEACDYQGWMDKAAALVKKKECKKAIGAYTRALLCQPKNPWAWFYRSELHEALGEAGLAKRDMDRADEFAGNDPRFGKRQPETFDCKK